MERKVLQMVINKKLTHYNFNDSNRGASQIKYIVIHYVGALGGAEANCKYYASQYVGASAHYFVGFNGEIWQSVEEADTAWHCGAKTYKHPSCRNSNSIGIEMCVRKKNTKSLGATDKDWYFEDATVASAIELTKSLMKKYNIPVENVIRHYDVTGKICPNPYVYNTGKHTWDEFKAALKDTSSTTTQLYRVRKSWDDAKSQIGAYESLENAKNACKVGYTVYDSNGKAVYTNSGSSSSTSSSEADFVKRLGNLLKRIWQNQAYLLL